jgi:hypothetical protein
VPARQRRPHAFAGFCATIFADNLGHVRYLVVAPDGTLYANTWSGATFPMRLRHRAVVVNADQIELAGSKSLKADIRVGIRDAALIVWIVVEFGEACLRRLDVVGGSGIGPPASFLIGREASIIFRFQPSLRLADALILRGLRLGGRVEGFALFNAERLQWINHGPIAL